MLCFNRVYFNTYNKGYKKKHNQKLYSHKVLYHSKLNPELVLCFERKSND